jgi:hypothetical protein
MVLDHLIGGPALRKEEKPTFFIIKLDPHAADAAPSDDENGVRAI